MNKPSILHSAAYVGFIGVTSAVNLAALIQGDFVRAAYAANTIILALLVSLLVSVRRNSR